MDEFNDISSMNRAEFYTYMSSLNWVEKVYYLESIERKYQETIPTSFYDVFHKFDRQLLLEQPTEVVTRLMELNMILSNHN
jgi:hypothetical protein